MIFYIESRSFHSSRKNINGDIDLGSLGGITTYDFFVANYI